MVGLLGRNGAGKTTLIRAITGLLRPERGSIRVGGIDVAADPRATRRMLGAAPQDLAVFPPLTVTENLWGWAELAGIGRSGRRRAVREVQDALGLAPLGDRPAHLLSGGEQRRLHCAMAMVARPPLLLLDEPTVGVDPQTRRALLDHLVALAASGTAVLYSTHYLTEIEQLGAYSVILHRGRVVARGGSDELVRRLSGASIDVTVQDTPLRTVRIPSVDPAAELPGVLAEFAERGETVVAVSIHRSSLEDAFLSVTGGATA